MSKARRQPRNRITGHDFVPPHCPNRECAHYAPAAGWSWRKAGSFQRKYSPERFQCFRCLCCGRYFSIRTFAGDYWLKRRDLFSRLVEWSPEGPGLRQAARIHGVSHTTVMRHLARASRFALLFHGEKLRTHSIGEATVVDGFETFEYSQYFPFHLNLAAGAESWFLYGFTDSPLRRKGRMTDEQKIRREALEDELGRPDPRAVENGMAELLGAFVAAGRVRGGQEAGSVEGKNRLPSASPDREGRSEPIVLHSDDHPAYPRAIRRVESASGVRFDHHVTSSRARRTTSNPLFPVNLADLLLRHAQANHRRETIAFSKRRQGAISRAALFLFWRNYVKRRRERVRRVTPATMIGWADRALRWNDLLRERRFVRAENLPEPWIIYYWHEVRTAALGDRQQTHRLKYAF